MKIVAFFSNVVSKIKTKINIFLYGRFTKYIVEYKPEGDNLRIITNFGDSRIVKNTEENQAKLNKIVVKSKLDIASRIDEYESTSQERLTVLIINIMLLGLSGLFVPLTFFTGSYVIFLLSIILFSFLSLAVSVIMIDYFVLVEEISRLKNITGYKMENEFILPKLKDLRNEIK